MKAIGTFLQFQRLVNPANEVDDKSAFILDDTTIAKTGRRIEQVSMVFDHVAGRKGSKLGFKNLTLGIFDGKIFKPLDFTLQAEKALKKARHRKEQYKKQRDPKSAGAKRIRECHVSKVTNGLNMLKRALKTGIQGQICTCRQLVQQPRALVRAAHVLHAGLYKFCLKQAVGKSIEW